MRAGRRGVLPLLLVAAVVALLVGVLPGRTSAQHASLLHKLMVKLSSQAADHSASGLTYVHELSHSMVEESVKAITGEAAGRTASRLSDPAKVKHDKAYRETEAFLALSWTGRVPFANAALVTAVIKRASVAAQMRASGVAVNAVLDRKVDAAADRQLVLAYRKRVQAFGAMLANPEGDWYGANEAFGLRSVLAAFEHVMVAPVMVPLGVDNGLGFLAQEATYALLHPSASRFCNSMAIAFRAWLARGANAVTMYDVQAEIVRRYVERAVDFPIERMSAAYVFAKQRALRLPGGGAAEGVAQIKVLPSVPSSRLPAIPYLEDPMHHIMASVRGFAEPHNAEVMSADVDLAIADTAQVPPVHVRRPRDQTEKAAEVEAETLQPSRTPAHVHVDPTSGHVE